MFALLELSLHPYGQKSKRACQLIHRVARPLFRSHQTQSRQLCCRASHEWYECRDRIVLTVATVLLAYLHGTRAGCDAKLASTSTHVQQLNSPHSRARCTPRCCAGGNNPSRRNQNRSQQLQSASTPATVIDQVRATRACY